MLDTDSVSFALRGHGRVGARIAQQRPSELCVSAVTVAELRYGADRRASRKLHRLIDIFTASIQPVQFDDAAAREYGRLASRLARRGTPIGAFDTLIAAHAVALNLVLVTGNVKHFAHVRGLRVENWT
ncbi:MAG: PIN domain-containing protein [Planctomycetes bacterium]|nr:PIN domain-containing protein [Planctomycetota bacterium]